MSRTPQAARWNAIQLSPSDTVATALSAIPKGTRPSISGGEGLQPPYVAEPIPRGHKFALAEISVGETIIKYGAPIGVATKNIAAGEHVHLHNLEGFAGKEARSGSNR